MEKGNGIRNVQELIAQYNQELMNTYRQSQPPPNEWLDKEYPMPDIERDRQVIAMAMPPDEPPTPDEPPVSDDAPIPDDAPTPLPPQDPTPPNEPAPYIGYLQIYAYTGSTAEPIQDAQVVISREENGAPLLYASTRTDRSGLTPIIPLPSVDPMLSMSPEAAQNGTPYIAYDIQVSALGFVPIRFENVPIYGGNSVTQSAAMRPLIAGENPDLPLVYQSGGPTNL